MFHTDHIYNMSTIHVLFNVSLMSNTFSTQVYLYWQDAPLLHQRDGGHHWKGAHHQVSEVVPHKLEEK